MTLLQGKNESYQSSEFQENLEILRNISFFSGIPIEKLKVFAYICKRENYKQGEYLFHQGEDDGQAFYILSGKARLIYSGEAGEEEIRDYDAGEFLGGIALMGDTPRLFSLKTLEEITCLIITREKCMSTIQQFPELVPRIIKSIVERISAWEGKFIDSREETCKGCMHRLGVSLL